MKYRNLIPAILIFSGCMAQAHDFAVTYKGQSLYFNITDKAKHTVEVTFKGDDSDSYACINKGVVEIPNTVKYGNQAYTVTAIDQKAFAHAKDITGVVIPFGVASIGNFAFEGCIALKSVVFPGNPVKLGEGVFFRCPSVSTVTIGSDWKTVDLTMFRWSNSLTEVAIPAKVEKIQGVKKLKKLESINVDPNNKFFSSIDGVLYSKDNKTLYACPRGRSGKLEVQEGTEKVLQGALIDCSNLVSLIFPSTLKSISFRETSNMKNLETIVMKSTNPIVTGYIDNIGKFLFQLANSATEIIVSSKTKEAYVEMLATEGGEYSEAPGKIRYMVLASQLPVKKKIKGVKNFNKY